VQCARWGPTEKEGRLEGSMSLALGAEAMCSDSLGTGHSESTVGSPTQRNGQKSRKSRLLEAAHSGPLLQVAR